MNFRHTEFPCVYQESVNQFGERHGEMINSAAETNLGTLIQQSNSQNSKAVKWHMDRNILPLIAIYFACLACEVEQQPSYDFCLRLAQIGAEKKKRRNAALSKMPFGYCFFMLLCKKVIQRGYPSAGWNVVWKRYDKSEIHFEFTSCIYAETTKAFHCPELCAVFCANDDTVLAGYAPKIIFERGGTIARGQSVCDFHFKNGANKHGSV